MSEKKRQQRRHCCVSHEFVRAATENLNKIAVIHARSSDIGPQISSHPPVYEGDRCFTFGDVLASVNYLSFRLRSILDGASDQHVTIPHRPPGDSTDTDESAKYVFVPVKRSEEFRNTYTPKIVGIYLAPSLEYIVSVLSVMRCGEAFLPLDPLWPKDRILSVASSSNVDLIVTCGTLIGGNGFRNLDDSQWLAEQSSCPVFFFSMAESLQECVAPLKLVWPCENEKERLFCYLMYTSGSTGKPKGVCGTETGLLNRFLWMQESYPLYGEELLLFKTSISFIDHLQEFLGAIFTSCTLIIPPFNEQKENLLSIITFLKAYSINRLTAVPSLLRAIVPALQSAHNMQIQSSLKLLILSGEVFSLSLWKMLSSLLPLTSILNLYGSTEVSGDCTYFDCKRLPKILETEALTTVPIGVPVSNCDVVLVGEFDKPEQGEICVGGLCICNGYFCESTVLSVDHESHQNSPVNCSVDYCKNQVYYKSGDLARRLQSGDLVFLGRRDRTVKVNGQRIAIEEIENTLRGHPNVADAAVIARKSLEELLLLEAFILLKDKEKSGDVIRSSIRNWIVSKLPTAMIPSRFSFIESLHMTSSGKVDYASLASSTFLTSHVSHDISKTVNCDLLRSIKKAFCDTLMVEEVSSDDDFFMLGGNSISAAHVSHNLGIDMRLLYNFPNPSKLVALLQEEESRAVRTNVGLNVNVGADIGKVSYSITPDHLSPEPQLRLQKMPPGKNDNHGEISKRLKMDTYKYVTPQCSFPSDGQPWNSATIPFACSFSRCNKVLYERGCRLKSSPQATWLSKVSGNIRGSLKDWWKVHMESCVDASPVVAFKGKDIYLFIGSHSRKFVCINARSGSVQWETVLDGRIECSAAIVGDFSQVVVGCYKGKIYFLDFANGNILWTFQTCGEVKSQPVMDFHRQLVWCGSHDHNLYALDYRNHCCVFKLPCGGSIYGSPAIDEDILYVASTSGRVTAISIKEFPFHTLWEHELRVPVFGSLSISSNGPVICCSVDGYVVALNSSGTAIWRSRTDGPIFAGACISHVLPSQVLICSRSGKVYSFELGNGNLLWEYNVGDPVTASAYAEEHLQLVSDSPHLPDRLVCVCSSSGSICVLRVNSDAADRPYHPSNITVHEFARFELQGDVYSSPVMIGGKIFVGCRDDYVHCISIETIEK
ncbi:putative acyl-activating enzyme 19 isoform X2 [Tripterygium wilfordii]|uniref:putative acyl-activating enzyme 19 isoform X2 n=1 Tax=Tripterygium wilfordii TaxID=458696 RepID=UPI0018F81EB1|nr:putative acyl-activating enzyme 19 isoform X2 [Tripterygium wilfordii]